MSAEDLLEDISERTGWDNRSKIIILCEYIDAQKDNDALQDFLEKRAEEEEVG